MQATRTGGSKPPHENLAFYLTQKGSESSNSVPSCAVKGRAVAQASEGDALQKHQGTSDKTAPKNGGSVWESNPLATGFTNRPTVLKTAATTRCANTSVGAQTSSLWNYKRLRCRSPSLLDTIRSTSRACRQDVILSPTMPTTISTSDANRIALAGSPRIRIPSTKAPMAPIPVQIA